MWCTQMLSRVMAVVKKYNFFPNSAARGLASKSSRTLSVVIPNLTRVFSDIYLGEIISGIYERATSLAIKSCWILRRLNS